jgi:hypothetical protein
MGARCLTLVLLATWKFGGPCRCAAGPQAGRATHTPPTPSFYQLTLSTQPSCFFHTNPRSKRSSCTNLGCPTAPWRCCCAASSWAAPNPTRRCRCTFLCRGRALTHRSAPNTESAPSARCAWAGACVCFAAGWATSRPPLHPVLGVASSEGLMAAASTSVASSASVFAGVVRSAAHPLCAGQGHGPV